MLELIGFITLLYLAIKYFPNILKFAFQMFVVIALVVLGVLAFEFIYHVVWNHGFYIFFQTGA